MTKRQRIILWLLVAIAIGATAAWIAIVLSTPAHAACHKYSIWKYPYPQRCPVQRVAQIEAPAPPAKPVDWPPLSDKPDIPLPSLKDMEFPPDCDAEWCQRLKGIGMLREKFGTN